MNRKVSLIFSKRKCWTPLGAIIMWWWNIPYSHVSIFWETPWDFGEVLEAGGLSVKMTEKSLWDEEHDIIYSHSYDLDKEKFGMMMRTCTSQLGKSYGWLQILGMIFAELFRLKKNPFADGSRSLVCSELVFIFCVKVLGLSPSNVDPDLVSPLDIYNMLSET